MAQPLSALSRGSGTINRNSKYVDHASSLPQQVKLPEVFQIVPTKAKLNDRYAVVGTELPRLKCENGRFSAEANKQARNVKLPKLGHKHDELILPKTFLTRQGALILFAENYLAHQRKQSKDRAQIDDHEQILEELKTLREFRNLVLHYGGADPSTVKYVSKSLSDDSYIHVRPGFSAARYITSATKLWDPKAVEKFINCHQLDAKLIESYLRLTLPDINIDGTLLKDSLLREKPQPFKTLDFVLPAIRGAYADILNNSKDATQLSSSFPLLNIIPSDRSSNSDEDQVRFPVLPNASPRGTTIKPKNVNVSIDGVGLVKKRGKRVVRSKHEHSKKGNDVDQEELLVQLLIQSALHLQRERHSPSQASPDQELDISDGESVHDVIYDSNFSHESQNPLGQNESAVNSQTNPSIGTGADGNEIDIRPSHYIATLPKFMKAETVNNDIDPVEQQILKADDMRLTMSSLLQQHEESEIPNKLTHLTTNSRKKTSFQKRSSVDLQDGVDFHAKVISSHLKSTGMIGSAVPENNQKNMEYERTLAEAEYADSMELGSAVGHNFHGNPHEALSSDSIEEANPGSIKCNLVSHHVHFAESQDFIQQGYENNFGHMYSKVKGSDSKYEGVSQSGRNIPDIDAAGSRQGVTENRLITMKAQAKLPPIKSKINHHADPGIYFNEFESVANHPRFQYVPKKLSASSYVSKVSKKSIGSSQGEVEDGVVRMPSFDENMIAISGKHVEPVILPSVGAANKSANEFLLSGRSSAESGLIDLHKHYRMNSVSPTVVGNDDVEELTSRPHSDGDYASRIKHLHQVPTSSIDDSYVASLLSPSIDEEQSILSELMAVDTYATNHYPLNPDMHVSKIEQPRPDIDKGFVDSDRHHVSRDVNPSAQESAQLDRSPPLYLQHTDSHGSPMGEADTAESEAQFTINHDVHDPGSEYSNDDLTGHPLENVPDQGDAIMKSTLDSEANVDEIYSEGCSVDTDIQNTFVQTENPAEESDSLNQSVAYYDSFPVDHRLSASSARSLIESSLSNADLINTKASPIQQPLSCEDNDASLTSCNKPISILWDSTSADGIPSAAVDDSSENSINLNSSKSNALERVESSSEKESIQPSETQSAADKGDIQNIVDHASDVRGSTNNIGVPSDLRDAPDSIGISSDVRDSTDNIGVFSDLRDSTDTTRVSSDVRDIQDKIGVSLDMRGTSDNTDYSSKTQDSVGVSSDLRHSKDGARTASNLETSAVSSNDSKIAEVGSKKNGKNVEQNTNMSSKEGGRKKKNNKIEAKNDKFKKLKKKRSSVTFSEDLNTFQKSGSNVDIAGKSADTDIAAANQQSPLKENAQDSEHNKNIPQASSSDPLLTDQSNVECSSVDLVEKKGDSSKSAIASSDLYVAESDMNVESHDNVKVIDAQKSVQPRTSVVSFATSTDFSESFDDSDYGDMEDDAARSERIRDAKHRKAMAAKQRRAEVDRKRREKEEARLLEEEAKQRRALELQHEQELEEERRLLLEERRRKTLEEEEAKCLLEEQEKLVALDEEKRKERERIEKERYQRRMMEMADKMRLDAELRREQERLAAEHEELRKQRELEMLKNMEEEERQAYLEQKRLEEAARLLEEKERLHQLELQQAADEQERQRLLCEMEEVHRRAAERKMFANGVKATNMLLDYNQQLTPAFTYSYYGLMPSIVYQRTGGNLSKKKLGGGVNLSKFIAEAVKD